jgi:topoisomerase-4 subunit B
MKADQLRETTMNPKSRCLIKIILPHECQESKKQVEYLMGKNPEHRYNFIQTEALNKIEKIRNNLDV